MWLDCGSRSTVFKVIGPFTSTPTHLTLASLKRRQVAAPVTRNHTT
jgi:hypothetical protein